MRLIKVKTLKDSNLRVKEVVDYKLMELEQQQLLELLPLDGVNSMYNLN